MNSNTLSPLSGGAASSNARGIDTARKVPLGEGRSLMDWMRNAPKKSRNSKEISVVELSKHNTETDCWISVRDIVYDVTQYIAYHPGGKDQIMRGAGMDATELFNQYHSWVNIESMLKTCIIGKLALSHVPNFKAPFMPALAVTAAQFATVPFFDWIQDDESVKLFINTKVDNLKKENVTILSYLDSDEFYVFVYLTDKLYTISYELQNQIKHFKLDISGKNLIVSLIKCVKDKPWTKVGKALPTNKEICNIKDVKKPSFQSKLLCKREMTHDCCLFSLEIPSNVFMQVAIGRHVYVSLRGQPELMRPYTPIPESFAAQNERAFDAASRILHALIKIYDDGQLTPDLNRVAAGDELVMSIQDGDFNPSRLLDAQNLLLLAAGTGITPILGVIDYCLKQKFIETRKIHLIFFNKTQSDMLFKEELQCWTKEFNLQFSVDHVLSSPNENWEGQSGRISQELLLNLHPNLKVECMDDSESLVCICGPSAFTDKSVKILTEELDISMYNIHTFRG